MFNLRKVLLGIFMLLSAVAFAQVRTLKGKVESSKGPLKGASVSIENGGGTFTEEDGSFSIEAPAKQVVLNISYVGFTDIRRVVKADESDITLLLEESSGKGNLGEVVVVAMNIKQKAKSLVYATQNVKTAELIEARDPNNILNSLQGKVANVVVTQSSAGVGGDARFILRGNRSLTGNSSALIVVDGIPLGNNVGDPGIQPDNIESVTILNGASGAALYGTAAGNGVIVISTKKGKANKLTVNVNSGAVFESPFALPKMQNTYGQGSAGTLDATAGDSWGAKMDGQSYTDYLGNAASYSPQRDNVKDFFRNGLGLNNSISVSGGSEKVQTFLSYANNAVQGIVPNNNLISHIINLRLTNQITKKISTDAKVTYLRRDIKNRPRSGEGNTPVLDIYQIPRNVSTDQAKQFETLNSVGALTPTAWPSTQGGVYGNPYWANQRDLSAMGRDNIVGFLRVKYQITDWLSLTGSGNMDKATDQNDRRIYDGTWSWNNFPGGTYSDTLNTYTQKWFDVMLEGTNKIGNDFRINYNVGAIYLNNKVQSNSTTANGLSVADKFSLIYGSTLASSQLEQEVETQSVFGKLAVSYKEAIYLDASLRNDWISVLPAPHSVMYPSIGTSVIISELVKLPKSISFLKANLNYAEVGNGGQFGLLSPYYNYSPGVGAGAIYRNSTLPFYDLKPELVKSIEAGVQARFLNNKLGFTLNLYKSNSTNQLLTLTVPVGIGYSTRYINAGDIQNKGVELQVSATPVSRKNFSWNIDFNLGMNRNKVLKISNDISVVRYGHGDWGGYPQAAVGGSFGDMTGAQWYKNDKGQFVVSAEGKPITTADMGLTPQVIGNPNPKATMGLTNSVTYKRFSARILVDGRVGGEVISGTEMNLSFSGITDATLKYREGGWNLGAVDANGQPVTNTITAQEFWQSVSSKRFGTGEFFVYDATNFRIREFSVAYDIPLNNNKYVKAVRLSAVGRNLLWLYRGSSKLNIPGLEKRKMWFDPDMTLGNGNFQGVEYGALPSTRSIGLNLQVTF
ncbi:MAG: SusC/RagA family TonB-linked outer membrane protein [Chitinophagaceae bacterium]|nr:SusC/RagA family TonB-linked outer membrane protein [Chitinophagaceae bacterium]